VLGEFCLAIRRPPRRLPIIQDHRPTRPGSLSDVGRARANNGCDDLGLSAHILPHYIAKPLGRFLDYSQASRVRIEALKGLLAELVETGLLVSDADLLRRCSRPDRQEEPTPRIASVEW